MCRNVFKYSMVFIALVHAFPKHHKHEDELLSCYQLNNDELDYCLEDFWNNIRPLLIEGIPGMKLEPLDPAKIDVLESEEKGSMLDTKIKLRDMEVVGAGDYQVTKVKVDRGKAQMTIDIFIPALYVSGFYEVQGVVMSFPIHNKGSFSLNLTEVDSQVVSEVVAQGTGVKADNIRVDFQVAKLQLALTAAAGEDQDMCTAISALVNNNSQVLLEEMKPKVGQLMSQAMLRLANRPLLKLPPKAFIQ